MSGYKCSHCEYYMWEGKEFYECKLEQENARLKQTLQDIKSIADEDCEFCDDIGGCMDNECRKVRILDLITKVEEE